MTLPKKTAPGRRIWKLSDRAQLRRELDEFIDEHTTGRPVWGRGVFLRHIVVDLFHPISYCGRFTGDTNTSPMPTLIGLACPTCSRKWNAAMDRRNIAIEAENDRIVESFRVKFAAFVCDDELEEFREHWMENVGENKELFRRLTAALIEKSGIDPQDVFRQVRERNGEHEPFVVSRKR